MSGTNPKPHVALAIFVALLVTFCIGRVGERAAIAENDCIKPVDTGQPAEVLLRAQTAYLQCLLEKKGFEIGGVCTALDDCEQTLDAVLIGTYVDGGMAAPLAIKPSNDPSELVYQMVSMAFELELLDPASDKDDAIAAYQIACWMKRWMIDDDRRSLRVLVGCD